MTLRLSKNARDLILSFEGVDQPWHLVGGDSGVTLGRGNDLRFSTPAQLLDAWGPHLSDAELLRLRAACGKVATAELCASFRDITITRAMADEVFDRYDTPRLIARTVAAFHGSELLPEDCFGALCSVVFNRGTSMRGPSRTEMRAIAALIPNWSRMDEATRAENLNATLRGIAAQLRSMKRLWFGKGFDGLIRRREGEAVLVESCISAE